ncbi:MAG: rod shape-determining protein MreD [Lachnospiraceae bacterium]|nr:rod shape-determining protein MreD [Lachnospiraceae bacterium]
MIRKSIEFLLVFFCFILQCTFFHFISLGGIAPNLLIILTSAFGFMKGRTEGMFVGFFSGLMMDVLFGNGIIGLYTLIYTYIGFFNGMFNRLFFPDDVRLPIILITFSDLVYCFIVYVLTFLLRSRFDFSYYLLHVIIPETVYTIFITILFYRLLLKLETSLEKFGME